MAEESLQWLVTDHYGFVSTILDIGLVFNGEDKKHEEAPKWFEDDYLEPILDEDPCQIQKELIIQVNVTQ